MAKKYLLIKTDSLVDEMLPKVNTHYTLCFGSFLCDQELSIAENLENLVNSDELEKNRTQS